MAVGIWIGEKKRTKHEAAVPGLAIWTMATSVAWLAYSSSMIPMTYSTVQLFAGNGAGTYIQ